MVSDDACTDAEHAIVGLYEAKATLLRRKRRRRRRHSPWPAGGGAGAASFVAASAAATSKVRATNRKAASVDHAIAASRWPPPAPREES